MSSEEFGEVLQKIKPFTNYIYLHVLGEPLLHPRIGEMLHKAQNAGIYVNITTNGGLIKRKEEFLLAYPPRQINISLHDAEENIADNEWDNYLENVLNFATKAAANTYINMRLWNGGVETSQAFNAFCLNKIAAFFNKTSDELIKKCRYFV